MPIVHGRLDVLQVFQHGGVRGLGDHEPRSGGGHRIPPASSVLSCGCQVHLLLEVKAAAQRLLLPLSSEDSSLYAINVLLRLSLLAAPPDRAPGWADPEVLHGVSSGISKVPIHVLLGDPVLECFVSAIRRCSCLRDVRRPFWSGKGSRRLRQSAFNLCTGHHGGGSPQGCGPGRSQQSQAPLNRTGPDPPWSHHHTARPVHGGSPPHDPAVAGPRIPHKTLPPPHRREHARHAAVHLGNPQQPPASTPTRPGAEVDPPWISHLPGHPGQLHNATTHHT